MAFIQANIPWKTLFIPQRSSFLNQVLTLYLLFPTFVANPRKIPNAEIATMSSKLEAAMTMVEIPLLSPYPSEDNLRSVGTTTAGLTALSTNLESNQDKVGSLRRRRADVHCLHWINIFGLTKRRRFVVQRDIAQSNLNIWVYM